MEARSWIRELPKQHVIIETDSLLVVNAMPRNKNYRLEVGMILEDCKSAMVGLDVDLVHVKKLANKTAHLMARVPWTLNNYKFV